MKKLIFILIFSLLLITPCSAAPYDDASLQDSLPDYARDLAGEVSQPANEGLEQIESALTETLSGGLSGVIKRALSIIAVAVICAVLTVFCDDAPEYVSLGGCAAIAVISASDVNSFISSGTDVITALSGFSKTLLPAMCAASAACGTLSSATVNYAASVLFLDSFLTIARSVVLPLIYAYLAVGIASSSFDSKGLKDISGLLKRVCTLLMTAAALGFTAYISISSVVASGGDAVASKLAKTAISTALPVVGGIISDAAGTVVAGAEAMRNTLGVFGMIALLAICISPFALMALNYIGYKLTTAAVKAFSCTRLGELTDCIGSAIGMILGLAGCCATILFVSMAVSIKAVGG